jgi:hypothetical protein
MMHGVPADIHHRRALSLDNYLVEDNVFHETRECRQKWQEHLELMSAERLPRAAINKVKLPLSQAVETHTVVRRWSSPHFLDNRLTDGGEVVSLRAGRPPFTPRRFLVLLSVRGWVNPRDIVRLQGLDQLKNPITSSGIEPATLRLVA